MFLIALSNIALAVLLALGPLFVGMLLFEPTRRFFAAWMAQLANYALITLLTVMVAALLLHVVQSYAVQTAARGAAILTVDALNMMLIATLVFLVLRQVMPIASGLAGGAALNSFGLVSRSVDWSSRTTGGAAKLAGKTAGPYVMKGLRGAARELGFAAGTVIGHAASSSGRYVYGRAGAGIGALARSWRNARR